MDFFPFFFHFPVDDWSQRSLGSPESDIPNSDPSNTSSSSFLVSSDSDTTIIEEENGGKRSDSECESAKQVSLFHYN